MFNIELELYILKLKILLAILWGLMLLLLLNSFGAGGAYSWAFNVLLPVFGLLAFLGFSFFLAPLFLPITACFIAFLALTTNLLPELMRKMFSAGGATDYTLLMLSQLGSISPAIVLLFPLLICTFVAWTAIEDKKNFELFTSFITDVLGAGGAMHWFLGLFLAATNPWLMIIPAVIVLLAGLTWYFKNEKEIQEVKTTCLSCFSWQTKGQSQTISKVESQVESGISHQAGLATFQ